MKTAAVVLPVILALGVPLISIGQELSKSRPMLFSEQSLAPADREANAVPTPALDKRLAGPSTNALPRLARPKQGQVVRPLSPHPNGDVPLAPGIYETTPYTCIVVVPGGHPDDKMIRRAPSANTVTPGMPIVKPELRFIPRGKK